MPVQAESLTKAPLLRMGESDEQDTACDIESATQNRVLPNKDKTSLNVMTMETDRISPKETYRAADEASGHIAPSSDEETDRTHWVEMDAREFTTKLPIVNWYCATNLIRS